MMRMAALRGRAGWGQGRWAARLTPNLLILRRTRRGLERSRRAGSRPCRSSLVARRSAWARLTAPSSPVRTLRRVACSALVKEIRSGSRPPWRAAEWISALIA